MPSTKRQGSAVEGPKSKRQVTGGEFCTLMDTIVTPKGSVDIGCFTGNRRCHVVKRTFATPEIRREIEFLKSMRHRHQNVLELIRGWQSGPNTMTLIFPWRGVFFVVKELH